MLLNISDNSSNEEQEKINFAPEEDELTFAPENDELIFASENDEQNIFQPEYNLENTFNFWKVMIVDDEPEVHTITKLLLKNFSFEGHQIKFIHAFSGQEAQKVIEEHPDTALILLDVVMESDEAGLQFIKYVREVLKNDLVQVILRTGQPGQVPEMTIVENYYINDYKTKTELTKPKLFTTIRTALRTFSSLYKLQFEIQLRQQVEASLSQLNLELEERVEQRTREIIQTNQKLQQEIQVRREAEVELQKIIQQLQRTQAQLIHAEKMSGLGQLVAGIAHEINNPVSFIQGNLLHAWEYAENLLKVVKLYQEALPQLEVDMLKNIEEMELEYLMEDFPKLIASMTVGAERIEQIVKSLRTFSRLDEAEVKKVNIHDGIESTLMILQHRLKGQPKYQEIKVIKEYTKLPLIECYPGQLNQVFMNLLTNAIDALEESNQGRSFAEMNDNYNIVKITTEVVKDDWIAICIHDNGKGIDEKLSKKLFEPFFTTKPVGKGTGLGLSISYQIIVELHGGKISCNSILGKGSEFIIEIPMSQ